VRRDRTNLRGQRAHPSSRERSVESESNRTLAPPKKRRSSFFLTATTRGSVFPQTSISITFNSPPSSVAFRFAQVLSSSQRGATALSLISIHIAMPPRRPGSTLASGRRRKSSTSTSVVARIQEQQQKRLEQEQQLQHQRSLAAALTAREVDADDDSDYGIELDDSVSGRKGQERRLPPNRRRNSIIVRYCFFRIVCRRAHQSFTLFSPLSLSDTHNPHYHAT